jgi:hypothetical protein
VGEGEFRERGQRVANYSDSHFISRKSNTDNLLSPSSFFRFLFVLPVQVVDAFPIHGMCGAFGVMMAGVMATEHNYSNAFHNDKVKHPPTPFLLLTLFPHFFFKTCFVLV